MKLGTIAFLAGAAKGLEQGIEQNKRDKEREEDRAFQQTQRDRQLKEQADADALQQGLKDANAPAAVQAGPTPDLSQGPALPTGNQDGQAPVFRMVAPGTNQTFSTAAEADQALKTYNAPQAAQQRTIAALQAGGQPERAATLQSQQTTNQLQQGQLAEQQWRRDLGVAMRGGHDGLAALGTNSNAGPMAGMTVKAVPSADGRTVTYSTVGKDGTVAPIPGLPSFSNDQNGVIQAAYMLDQTITPAQRMEHYDQLQQQQRVQGNADRSFGMQEKEFGLRQQEFGLQQNQDQRAAKVTDLQLRAGEAALKKAVDENKVPKAVQMSYEGNKKELDTIGTSITKAQADGSWQPDSPGAKQLLQRQAVLTEKNNALLQPYLGQNGTAGADPFGLKGGSPTSFQDPKWDDAEARASRVTGVPVEVIRSIRVDGERSNGDQVSPKGAKGVYQFMPATRDAFLKQYGVDAYSVDPAAQALAAAIHLKESYGRTGDWKKAVGGYNGGISGEKGTNKTAENAAYTARVMAPIASTYGGRMPAGTASPAVAALMAANGTRNTNMDELVDGRIARLAP